MTATKCYSGIFEIQLLRIQLSRFFLCSGSPIFMEEFAEITRSRRTHIRRTECYSACIICMIGVCRSQKSNVLHGIVSPGNVDAGTAKIQFEFVSGFQKQFCTLAKSEWHANTNIMLHFCVRIAIIVASNMLLLSQATLHRPRYQHKLIGFTYTIFECITLEF